MKSYIMLRVLIGLVNAMHYMTSKNYDDMIEEVRTRGRIIGVEYQVLRYSPNRVDCDETSIDGTVLRIENDEGIDIAEFPGEFTRYFAEGIMGCNAEYKVVHRTLFPGSQACFESHRYKLEILDGPLSEFELKDTIII